MLEQQPETRRHLVELARPALHALLEIIPRPLQLFERQTMGIDLGLELGIGKAQLIWARNGERLGDQREYRHGRGHGNCSRDQLDHPLELVDRIPERDQVHEMGDPAPQDERREHARKPPQLDIGPLTDENPDRNRDSAIGREDQHV